MDKTLYSYSESSVGDKEETSKYFGRAWESLEENIQILPRDWKAVLDCPSNPESPVHAVASN